MKRELPKWCFASIAKHFDDNKQNVVLFIEGQHRETNRSTDYAELRMLGPNVSEPSKEYYVIDVVINVLVASTIDDKDAYRYLKTSGIILEAFTPSIQVLKLGDDDSLLGCLQLKNTVTITHYGLDTTTRGIRFSEIEGKYQMVLT